MKTEQHLDFLSVAYAVLSQAGRPMHYTQITSVGLRLGILRSASASPEIAMSSMLSHDIRTNSESLFVKERRGVYALSEFSKTRWNVSSDTFQYENEILDKLRTRTGLADRNEIIIRALYLTGRTLDLSAAGGPLEYQAADEDQTIEVNLNDLVKEFEAKEDGKELVKIATASKTTWLRTMQVAKRLGLEEPKSAVEVSLFLLELAIDLVEPGNLLVIQSATSSIKVPVKRIL